MEGDSGAAEEEPQQPAEQAGAEPSTHPATRATRRWLWPVAVLAVVAVVGLVIGALLGGRQGGPLSSTAVGTGRPTIVVGTAAASPSSTAAVVGSPSAAPSTVVAGATAVGASSVYVVKPGDTLRSIAEQQYGDPAAWPRIYDANRNVIGPDPDALVAGTTLQIPPRQ